MTVAELQELEEVKLLHWREPVLAGRMVIGGRRFRRQAPGTRARGFWHHHFVRAGELSRAGVLERWRIEGHIRREIQEELTRMAPPGALY